MAEVNKKDSKKGKSTKETQTQSKSKLSQDFLAALLGGEEEKKPKKRPYLHFKDFGLVIPFWAIVSVEKAEEFRHSNIGTLRHCYELIINRGIESSPNMPFGERVLCYETVELRDAKHAALIEALKEHNYEFSDI